MGAWGYLPFENDDALDWLDELEGGGGDVIRRALAKANNGYVDAPEGSIAIAAPRSLPAARATRRASYRRTSPTG